MPGCLLHRWVDSFLGELTYSSSTFTSQHFYVCRLNQTTCLMFSDASCCLSICPTLESSMNEDSLAWLRTPLSTESWLVKTKPSNCH